MEYNKVFLKEMDWPDFGIPDKALPEPMVAELEKRLQRCHDLMDTRNLTHLVVYGDREHFANLMYLTHFDPRFEEALLIISQKDTPLILVGNECVGHLSMSPLYHQGKLRYERYQSFSLVSQPREESRPLKTIFEGEGINSRSKIGCAGWKYFTGIEFPNPEYILEIPSYIVEVLRSICGYEHVVNATDLFMSPRYGLRTQCSVHEVVFFEYANMMASEGMKNLLKNFQYGITDFELIREYQYTGYPLSCHIGMKSSGNQHIGLSGPVGAVIKKGDPCSTNIGYWGSNICRAGWVATSEDDLPGYAKGYVEKFAAPYFYACTKWYENLKIGTKGKVLREIIDAYLPFEDFAVYLNPGHLIHYDEWVSSPICKDSEDEIRSGMYLQVDIIPRSKKYFSSRMEDGVIIADVDLQNSLKELYTDVYERCMQRRRFMIEELGFSLPHEILPLSNIPGIVPPFFLNYKQVLSLNP
jgi:Xaa-Pro aminopeptidase